MTTLHHKSITSPPTVHIPSWNRGTVLAVWAAAAVPMAGLSWIVAPLLSRAFSGPTALPQALILSLTAGMIWQFFLVLFLVRREQGSLRWSVIKPALWLQAPRSPSGSRVGGWLWLVVLPCLLLFAAEEAVPITRPAGRDLGSFLSSAEGEHLLAGNWVWYAAIVTLGLFNTVLGEELLFRGLLLPRMGTAFGRRDWLANGILFSLYHLHVPWAIPAALVDTFALAYPSRRYRSALIGIAVHSAQTLTLVLLGLSLVLK